MVEGIYNALYFIRRRYYHVFLIYAVHGEATAGVRQGRSGL